VTNKPKRLGRGLEALLSRTGPVDPPIQVPAVHPSLFQPGERAEPASGGRPSPSGQGPSGLPGSALLAHVLGQSAPGGTGTGTTSVAEPTGPEPPSGTRSAIPSSGTGSETPSSGSGGLHPSSGSGNAKPGSGPESAKPASRGGGSESEDGTPTWASKLGSLESESPGSLPVRRIALGLIDSNPFQPREDFDPAEMRSLAESLQTHGLLQPVVVRRVGDRYQLIAGERRLRAAELAGWTDVPAQVIEADDRQVAELAIVENLQRKDLNPLEKAACFQRYLETYHCTQEELANRLKIDRSTIANLIRLLELPEEIQVMVRQGRLSQGHARALLPLGDPEEQIAVAQRIQQEGLNVRQTEALVQQMLDAAEQEGLAVPGPTGQRARSRRAPSEHVLALEQEFRSALGTKVKLVHTRSGRGRLVIFFRNHEEFERIRQQICDGHVRSARRQAG